MKSLTHILILFFVFFSFTLHAANFYTAENNSLITVNEHSVCKNVTNLNTKSLFVPTSSSAEWLSFRTNTPSNVNLTDCCPAGYVPVPGDNELGTHNFCVMVYEAKNVSGNPTSQANSTPWVSINYATTVNECRSLGTGYDLITNWEWQTIVRNAEYVDSNWSGASRGLGCLMMGNNGSDTSCSYDKEAIDYGTSRNPKAKLTLSNNVEIYDIGGNVSEFVRGSYTLAGTDGDYVGASDPGWADVLAGVDKLYFGPKGDYTLGCTGDDSVLGQCGLGFQHLLDTIHIVRGGLYNDDGSDSFFAHLNLGGWDATDRGFRCVYRPDYTTWLSYTNASPPTNPGFETGNFTGWTQTSGDDGNWNVVSSVKFAGTYSARSKNTQGNNEISCIERVVNLTSASNDYRIQWLWKISSEEHYDFGHFYINNNLFLSISGEQDWFMESIRLTQGSSYTVKWCYEKDSSDSGGSDYLWLDNFDAIELN